MRYFYALLAFLSISCKSTAQISIKNPLSVKFGDPFILYDADSDRYYMYGTGGVEDGFMAYSSQDLQNWKSEGQVYDAKQDKGWGIKDFWAPEVYHYKGSFYMFYSAHWKNNPNHELENYKIGVAVSEKPTGPFLDLKDEPVFDPGYPIIDANVFFDEDDRLYLYYSRVAYKHPVETEISEWAREKGLYDEIEESWVYGVEIADDFSHVIGKPKLLLRPPEKMDDAQAEWESRSVTNEEVNRRWTEGSFLLKDGNQYYLMYSANHFGGEDYAVGYATSDHPLGPFKKAKNNPILQKNSHHGSTVSGTGHNMVFNDKQGRKLIVYHGRTPETGEDRVVFINQLKMDKNGQLKVIFFE